MTWFRRGATSVYAREFFIPLAESRILLSVVAPLEGTWLCFFSLNCYLLDLPVNCPDKRTQFSCNRGYDRLP